MMRVEELLSSYKEAFHSQKRTPQTCDRAEQEFCRLIRDEEESLMRFNPKSERLYEFYHRLLSSKEEEELGILS